MTSQLYVKQFEIDPDHSVYLYRGSLTGVVADALVSSDDNYLSASGGVSAALAEQAGRDVRHEMARLVQQNRPKLGDIVRTSGGALPCQHLYHAITIDDDEQAAMDEAVLRKLVRALLARGTVDGVKSIGMPALGTGAAFFDLGRAAEIIVEELVSSLVETPVGRLIIAIVEGDAQMQFYERLVRSQRSRLTSSALRRAASTHVRPEGTWPATDRKEQAELVEQFPSPVDAVRLASAGEGPRLVEGLATLILQHAAQADVEQELLNLPCCSRFRGTVKQRLMEFLYLEEKHLRLALGQALFSNRDLRKMITAIGEDPGLHGDNEQLIDVVLRKLCFNLLSPPCGIAKHLGRMDGLLRELSEAEPAERVFRVVVIEAGLTLERTLSELLKLYGMLLWGGGFESTLVERHLVTQPHDGSAVRATLGQLRDALVQLERDALREPQLRAKIEGLGRGHGQLLPSQMDPEGGGPAVDARSALQEMINVRNDAVHARGPTGTPFLDRKNAVRVLEAFRSFLRGCKDQLIYPDVLRYEGTFENRNGERFVHFLDEQGSDRKVRTDDRIDPRRHYYCFSTNNPVHLHPVLVPKL